MTPDTEGWRERLADRDRWRIWSQTEDDIHSAIEAYDRLKAENERLSELLADIGACSPDTMDRAIARRAIKGAR